MRTEFNYEAVPFSELSKLSTAKLLKPPSNSINISPRTPRRPNRRGIKRQGTTPERILQRIKLKLKLARPQMMLADQIFADAAEDVVQKEPRDVLVGVGLDADCDRAAVCAILEEAVGDIFLRVELDVGADAVSGEVEAR